MGSAAAAAAGRRLTVALGGAERTRVIIVLAAILGLERRRCRDGGRLGERAPVGPAHHEHRHRPARRGQLPRRRVRVAAVRRPGRPCDANPRARGDDRHVGRRDALERDRLELHGAAVDATLPRRRHRLGRPDGRLARRRLVRELGARAGLRLHPRRRVRRRRHRLRGDRQRRRALVAGRLRHPRPAGVRARLCRVAAARAGARREGRARLRQGSSAARSCWPRRTRTPRRPTRSGWRGSAAWCPIPSSSSTRTRRSA